MADDKSAQNKASEPATAFTSFFQTAPHLQHLMLFGPRMQAALLRASVAQQKETTSFLAHRCDEELKLADQIMAAATVKDVFSACMTFWQDAAAQYAREAGRTVEVQSRNALEVVDELRSEASAAAATVEPMRYAA